MTMEYQLGDVIVREMVSFLQRVFRYNSSWLNSTIEVVQVPSGSTLQIFEVFSEEAEKYPSVAVASLGGTFQHLGINNVLGSNSGNAIPLGIRSIITKTIDDVKTLAVQLTQEDIENITLRGLSAYYAWTGEMIGGDDISVILYKNYTTTPIQVASASLPGRETVDFQESNTEFNPYILMDGSDYWLLFSSTADSPYYVGIDDSITTNSCRYTDGAMTAFSGSVTGKLFIPEGLHIGGGYNSSIGIRTRAKNSSKLAQQMSELIAQYCEYAKHAYINRNTGVAVHGLSSIFLNAGVAEFAKKGIYIQNTRIGPVESKPRAPNDNIFSVLVTIDCFSQWEMLFPAQTLLDTTIETVTSY